MESQQLIEIFKQPMSKEIEPHILKLYKTDKLLGSGAYGHVWKVEDRLTGEVLALKKIFDAFQNSTDAQRTYREITVLDQLRHTNIISLKRVIRSTNNKDIYLVFEYMESDLHSILEQNILELVHQKYIAYQIFRALKYIHSAELIHRDLKPCNVLVNSECTIKVCDFGLVRSLIRYENQEVVLSEEVATRWYRSPEVLLGCTVYGKPADMWSVGCILVEMLTAQPLFPGKSTLDQLERIVSWTGMPSEEDLDSLENNDIEHLLRQINPDTDYKRQVVECIPEEFVGLVCSLLSFNAKRRPKVEECLKLPIFQEFHNPSDEPVCHKKIMPPINDNVQLELKNYRDIIYTDIDRRYPQNSKIKYAKRSTSQKKKSSTDSKKSKQTSIYTKSNSIKGSSPNFNFLNTKPSMKYLSPCKSVKKLGSTMKPSTVIAKPKEKQLCKKKPVKIEKTSTAALLRNKSKESLFSRKESHKKLAKVPRQAEQKQDKDKSIVIKKSRSKPKKEQFTSSTAFEDKQKQPKRAYV